MNLLLSAPFVGAVSLRSRSALAQLYFRGPSSGRPEGARQDRRRADHRGRRQRRAEDIGPGLPQKLDGPARQKYVLDYLIDMKLVAKKAAADKMTAAPTSRAGWPITTTSWRWRRC